MKFHVSSDQQTYYKENLSIEFDHLLSLEEVEELERSIGDIIAKRLKCSKYDVWNKSSRELFSHAGDLWRENPSIQEMENKRPFLEIATQLFGHKPFRMGYDLFLPSYNEEKVSDTDNLYKLFIKNRSSFKESCCIQGTLGGMIICLKGGSENKFLPSKPGNIVFFSPDCHLDFRDIGPSDSYLFFTYIKSNAIFIKNVRDPLYIPLKKLGYTIGDRIIEEIHPLICK